MTRMEAAGEDSAQLARMRHSFEYMSEKTCAADGLCAELCPVGIDTGKFIKTYRENGRSGAASAVAGLVASNLGLVTAAAPMTLRAAQFALSVPGDDSLIALSRTISRLSGERIPIWNPKVLGPAGGITLALTSSPDVIYFPSCVSRTFGASLNAASRELQSSVFLRLLRKAGFNPAIASGTTGLCCVWPFPARATAKRPSGSAMNWRKLCGLHRAAARRRSSSIPAPAHTGCGKIREQPAYLGCTIRLSFCWAPPRRASASENSIALHVPCSVRKMSLGTNMVELAEPCATHVWVQDVNAARVADLPATGASRTRNCRLPP
jgi:D-lactate dehydrogenase